MLMLHVSIIGALFMITVALCMLYVSCRF
uniref:Uncharacterized protein n=1 Tax=Anguilla anguilla TaxID=7936 RepID=A0A0E9UAL2_ANGAN